MVSKFSEEEIKKIVSNPNSFWVWIVTLITFFMLAIMVGFFIGIVVVVSKLIIGAF